MYESVHAHPDGRSTVARFALTASEYGFDGIVVRNHGDNPATYDPAAVATTYDIDVVTGVEIRADSPAQASGFLGSHRQHNTVVCVHGGTNSLNRFAVEQAAVDVLAHPMAGDGDFNHVLARKARENGVHVEFNLGRVLRDAGGSRVRTLAGLRKLREIIAYYDTPYVVTADPHTHLQMRAPRELVAVGEAIGFSAEEVTAGLRAWEQLVMRNRDRQSKDFVQPGVWRVDTDSDE